MGTADYMSPEQAEGRRVDARSDLYSLGCVLYALLAGRPPFCADSLAEVLDKLRFAEPVPVGKRAEDVPDELERVVMQLLAKDPRRRIPTSLAVVKRLEAMLHALSIKADSDEFRASAESPGEGEQDGDFLLQDPEAATDEHVRAEPPIALRETIPAVPPPAGAGPERRGPKADAAAGHSPADAAAVQTEPGDIPAAGRFTSVEEERSPPRQSPFAFLAEPTWWFKLVGLVTILSVAVWLVIAALKPPTGDQLFERIQQAGRQQSVDALLKVENEMQAFLGEFPNDPRAAEVRSFVEEIELYRLARRFERQSRRAGSRTDLLPVERTYLEAMQLAPANPELAVLRLEALLAVFGSEPQLEERAQQCVELARRQRERLRGNIDHWSREHLQAILDRLDHADSLQAADPAAAHAIRRGVVELYQDKPWAAAAVKRARESLSTSQTPPE
jgi:serine/threonine-protein kinase